MKRLLLLAALGGFFTPLRAQHDARILRAESLPYETRQSAEAGDPARSPHVIPFSPQPFMVEGDAVGMGALVEIPYRWTDGCVYIHLENVGHAYTLKVNGREAASTEDAVTPADYDITPYVREGKNAVVVDIRPSRTPAIEQATPKTQRRLFDDWCLYMQDKRSIVDYELALVPDSTEKFGILNLQLVVRNAYNYDEPVTVGYDLYSPDGKLLHFDFREMTVPGRSTDTLRISQPVYHTYRFPWIDGKAPLYRVMLYTKRDGQLKEYMPLRVGFGRTELAGGRLMRLGKEVKLNKTPYDAAADRTATRREMQALKAKGFNTLCPSAPQPGWYYDLCDELGLYVIECPNINAPEGRGDRTVGGTPSNDPALCDEYLARVKAMYYRTRSHTSIIAYTLGGDSGNGYNMYKAYEWLKSVEPSRPVIYADADGEWNSDL